MVAKCVELIHKPTGYMTQGFVSYILGGFKIDEDTLFIARKVIGDDSLQSSDFDILKEVEYIDEAEDEDFDSWVEFGIEELGLGI